MSHLRHVIRQVWPRKPEFTEQNVEDLSGKVYIVTGSNVGVGKDVAEVLYSKNAKVYVAARSEEKAMNAIESIKAASPKSKGELVFLKLDLGDLSTIKASVEAFLSKESKLHVLFNNAGVMFAPVDMKTAQGHDLQLGTNCIGHFLLVKLLTPVLVSTAKAEPPNTVRVIWVSSSMAEMSPAGGVPMDNLDYHKNVATNVRYAVSKAGNYLHAAVYAERHKEDGIISIPLNPGNLKTALTRHMTGIANFFVKYIQYPSINGAYTELYAGLSPDVTIEKSGSWVVPWGRFCPIRKDLEMATKPESEGGSGIALKWWEWNEEQVKPYL